MMDKEAEVLLAKQLVITSEQNESVPSFIDLRCRRDRIEMRSRQEEEPLGILEQLFSFVTRDLELLAQTIDEQGQLESQHLIQIRRNLSRAKCYHCCSHLRILLCMIAPQTDLDICQTLLGSVYNL